MAASLISIASIHLLKAFGNVAYEDPEPLKWSMFIHMTFPASTILLSWTDKITQKERTR